MKRKGRTWTTVIVVAVAASAAIIGLRLNRHRDNTLPIDDVFAVAPVAQPGQVNLKVLRCETRVGKNGTRYAVVLGVANDGPVTIRYPGYKRWGRLAVDLLDPEDRGEIWPSYDWEVLENGEWKPRGFFCGTGVEILEIQPGQAARFEVLLHEGPDAKIAFTFHTQNSSENQQVWTDAVDARNGTMVQTDEDSRYRRPNFWLSLFER